MSEAAARSHSRGYSDQPTCEDALGMADRYKGLAKFICECETPMTIAINGDWGSGKSSAMKIIQEDLVSRTDESVRDQIIEFNTWEFSVICDNSKLVFELLQTLNNSLIQLEAAYKDEEGAKENGKRVQQILSAFSLAGNAVKDLTIKVLEESDAKYVFSFFKGISGDKDPSGDRPVYTSPTQLLREVSENIQSRIQSIVKKLEQRGAKAQRLFIFVDDLDRLEPGIALELIEGMKNFAAYENCVFILAVDQSVVERGLKSKYGNEISDEMAQHFFDKIIQLPFKLPVNAYDLSGYVRSLLEKNAVIADKDSARNMAGKFASLLKAFHITNPRTIKRSFNMLHMYQCMNECRTGADGTGLPDGGASAGQYYKEYAVLLLLLTSPEDHAKMAQLVDSGCDYTGVEALRQIQEAFQSLRLEKDGEACSDYIAAVLDLFYEGGDGGRATKELADALSFTKSDDVDHDSYALAQFLLELLSRIKRCPENEAAVRACGEWPDRSVTPYALAKKSEDLCIELDGLAGENKVKISWERSKRFFISLHSPQLTVELLDRLGCFKDRYSRLARLESSEDVFNCYFSRDRITIFVANAKNTGKIFQLLEECGVFGPLENAGGQELRTGEEP